MPQTSRVILPWTVDVKPTWTVAQVRTALQDHEWGTFTESAKLWSAMGRDDRLTSVLDTRIDGVIGSSCRLVPEDEDDAKAVKIARRQADLDGAAGLMLESALAHLVFMLPPGGEWKARLWQSSLGRPRRDGGSAGRRPNRDGRDSGHLLGSRGDGLYRPRREAVRDDGIGA